MRRSKTDQVLSEEWDEEGVAMKKVSNEASNEDVENGTSEEECPVN